MLFILSVFIRLGGDRERERELPSESVTVILNLHTKRGRRGRQRGLR